MHTLRKLVRELHRRSVWQVLVVYTSGSWIGLKGVAAVTRWLGLPSWTLSLALSLLLVGLPLVLLTTVVQKGVPWLTDDPHEGIDPFEVVGKTPAEVHRIPERHPLYGATLFTWPNAMLGGVGAVTLLVASVVAYMTMWGLGIGPVGSLAAQGLVEPGDRILVAELGDAADEDLGGVVTEVLRVDLEHSTILRPVAVPELAERFGQRGGLPREGLSGDQALALAAREGIEVVLVGEIAAAGDGYVVTATLRDGSTGRALSTLRSRVEGPGSLVVAADRLALKVRERAGESLKTVRAEEPMVEVMEATVEDLRLFHRARILLMSGDPLGAVALLEQAVRSSGDFALAWRELGPLQEQVGDTTGALRSYRRVLEVWSDADPRGRAARTRALERIQALEGQGRSPSS
ncbi:MAG: hypothetical protein P8170_03775 [Gemmatimonadota bacterium]